MFRAETTVLDRYEKFIVINIASTPIPTSCAGCLFCFPPQDNQCSQGGDCTATITLRQPTLAYAVSIYMTKRKMEDFGYSLYEVEAYGPDDPTKNLLKGGAVEVSSTEENRYIAEIRRRWRLVQPVGQR